MGMSTGGGGGIKSEINVTPLVDVVLVLLIIFMVVQPMLQMGYEVETPPEVKTATPQPPDPNQIIVNMDAEGRPYINKQVIPKPEFGTRLAAALKNREKKIVFFAANGELSYEKVVAFMDQVRDAGAQNLGIVFDDLNPTS
jgi:biopolymer transport protein ExbD